MKNEIICKEQTQPSVRDINTITSEILSIKAYAKNTAIACAVELGRRFKEAKEMLPHGEWGKWLKETVDFSQSSVINYMKIFEEYGSEQISLFGATVISQSIEKLSYTQAIKLFAIPREEREEFIEENDVENLSIRELDKVIKERDEAIKRAQDAEKKAQEYESLSSQIEESNKEISRAESEKLTALEDLKKAEQKLKDIEASLVKEKQKNEDLKKNPKIPQVKMDEILKEAKANATNEVQKEINDLKAQIEKANAEKSSAEASKKEAENKLKALETKEIMSNSLVAEFKLVFDRLQNESAACLSLLEKAKNANPDIASKFQKALDTFVLKITGEK